MNIRVDLNYAIKDGTEVVFRSPVDCSQITGLKVYYADGGISASKEFVLADAHGSNVGDIDHLFAENVVVKVILDVTSGMAFVQNADTNAYIERTFVKTVNGKTPDQNGNVNVEGGGTGGVTDEQIATAVEAYMAENPAPKGDPFTYEDFTEEQLADLKGPKGDPGKSVTITHIAESDGDGAINMVAFSDGKTLTIKNGSKGSPGTTPHIGENGNWWIGETDTGVSASGGGATVEDVLAALPTWTGGSY